MGKTARGLVCVVLLSALAAPGSYAFAQERTTTAVAGPQYGRSAFAELFVGRNWRDLWTTPVRVPVLDLATHGGGLTAMERGGRQSRTLHFQGADGRRYIFRSVDKFLHEEAVPPDVRHTPVGDLVQDQISMLYPAAGLIAAPIQEAVGILHSWPTYVVMPDDARLGEFREMFAGMLGQLEENPDEGPDDSPGFAGSRKVHNTENFFERLDESPEYRLQTDEYLKVRLIDFLVGDTDRGGDQWKFARFPRGDGYIYRPIPRDRDFAFMVTDGLLSMIVQRAYQKLLDYDGSYESLRTLTFMTRDMDRRLLVEIPRAQWDSIVADVQARVTDNVLRSAVGNMPPEYQRHATAYLLDALLLRRDRLHEPAAEFYEMVAREADVHGTAEAERAEIERYEDGSVEVRLYAGAAAAVIAQDGTVRPAPPAERSTATPYFQRRFVPGETREVRVYMHGGDDQVRVTGESSSDILIRVIGGAGDDVLEDVSRLRTGATGTVFYTARGDDRVTGGAHTRIDPRGYADPPPGRPEDMKLLAPEAAGDTAAVAQSVENEQVVQKLSGASPRDWGVRGGLGPAVDHRSGVGMLAGMSYRRTRYGFRREPHATQLSIAALYAPELGAFGIELDADRRFENTPFGVSLEADASQFASFRFSGWGNDTPVFDGNARVRRDEIVVRPALWWRAPALTLSLGPVLRYGRAHFDEGSPIDVERPPGSDRFGQVGAWARARIERGQPQPTNPRGVIVEAGGSAYPALLDVAGTYGAAHAVAHVYAPVPGPGATFVALRAGAHKLFGDFPVHDAALLGGRNTLRGHMTERFAGDAMLYGSAQLHVPVATMTLLVRGRLGAFALADAGRVYFAGASPGGWHTAVGGGLSFSTLGQMVSVTYAQGEAGRIYLDLGLPF
ncbi:MAG TPA: hypothetical protein VMN60_00570 [Longimicrobiales bacterium]|nr:hypothetical protein [Longimicrobiales bacterium]